MPVSNPLIYESLSRSRRSINHHPTPPIDKQKKAERPAPHNASRAISTSYTPHSSFISHSLVRLRGEVLSGHLHSLILVRLAAERLRLVTRDARLPRHATEAESRTA